MEDTICAVSTAPGAGGIAVIRISGPEAIAICNTIFVPRTAGKACCHRKPIHCVTVVSGVVKSS